MKLDIVLEWMKTFDGKVTPAAIQRHFGIAYWPASRIYELLVKGGHVTDDKRQTELLRESKQAAAEEMYDMLDAILSEAEVCEWRMEKIEELLKKARGE